MSSLSGVHSRSALASDQTSKPGCGCVRSGSSARSEPRVLERGFRLSEGGHRSAPSVLVVFTDHAACVWLRPLRRGFRHCFVVLRTGSLWLACEPLKDRIELDVLALPPDFDLAAFYGAQGHRVLLGRRPPPRPRRSFAPAPLTCVTVVKRLLGIDASWVWTPWQLYAHLTAPELGFQVWSESTRPARDDPRQLERENSVLTSSRQ